MWRAWMLCCLLFCASVAYAGPKEMQAQKKLGEQLMADGNYQEALSAFEEAKKQGKDPSLDLAIAGALLKLRKFEEAKASYQLFLDSGKASKTDQKKIKEALDAIDSTLKTSVVCQSDPAGAKLYLNSLVDGYVGETPITFNLPPGEHRLFFQKDGFQTKTEKLSIAEGDKRELSTKLAGLPFTAMISSAPAGAEVFIDGASRGVTPLTIELEAGKHEVKLTKVGFGGIVDTIEGSAGQKVTLEKALSSMPGKIQLTLKPERAEAKIEGREEKLATGTSLELPAGEYTLTASALGYQEQQVKLISTSGETDTVDVALTPVSGLLLVKAPSGVSISLNGQPQKTNELIAMPPGTYPISLSAAGKVPYTGEVALTLGEAVTLTPSLAEERVLSSRSWLLASGASLGAGIWLGSVYLYERKQSIDPKFNPRQLSLLRLSPHIADAFFVVSVGTLVASQITKRRAKSSVSIQSQKEPR